MFFIVVNQQLKIRKKNFFKTDLGVININVFHEWYRIMSQHINYANKMVKTCFNI